MFRLPHEAPPNQVPFKESQAIPATQVLSGTALRFRRALLREMKMLIRTLTLALGMTTALVLPIAAQSQPVLQPQSQQDFSRVLSPGLVPRALTPEKLQQLQKEAAKDCFQPDSFQQAVPPLAPNQKRPLPCAPKNPFDRFVMWNQIALDTTAIDHAPPPPGEKTNPALHHLGPHRSSRAMAIVHIALFDAINVATRFNQQDPKKPNYTFATYSQKLPEVKQPVSLDTVITYAAGEVLKVLYKEQSPVIEDFIAKDEVTILGGKNRNDPFFRDARELGKAAAKAILDDRKDDGAAHVEPEVGQEGFPLSETPGKWRPDPVSNIITALGADGVLSDRSSSGTYRASARRRRRRRRTRATRMTSRKGWGETEVRA